MQRWWLVVAGVVGIGLAVLLVPRPDTGDAVADREAVKVEPGAGPIDDGSEPTLVGRTPVTDASPAIGPDGVPHMLQPSGTIEYGKVPGDSNPRAARMSARVDTPEGRYAGKALAPWTQVRRELAEQTADAGEIQVEVDRMIDDMRVMLRDPPGTDAAEIEKRQVELISQLRASEYNDPEMEKMLTLLDTRLEEYRADRDASPTPSEGTTP